MRPFLTLWLWGPVVLSAALGRRLRLGVRSVSSVSAVSAVSVVSAWSGPKASEPVDPDFVKLLTRYS